MPKHVETRICRDCGTEFALPQTARYAVRCPICRKRHDGNVHVYTAPEDKGGGMSGRTEKQLAGDRRRCLNGTCRMTREERNARKRKYVGEVLADPFRHARYTEYFRKRRARPGMRERGNAQARARYHADVEKSREKCREKYRRMMADPERHAAFLERRRKRRRRPDGKPTAAARAAQIREKLIPRWERVIADGREEAYSRRTTHENALLFHLYVHNRPLFDEMLGKATRKEKPNAKAR